MGIKTMLGNANRKLKGITASASRNVPGYRYRFLLVIPMLVFGTLLGFHLSVLAPTLGEQARYGAVTLLSLLATIYFVICQSVALKPPPVRECYGRRRRTRRR